MQSAQLDEPFASIGIPAARFVVLESRSHILLGHEPAWDTCMEQINRFLDGPCL